MYSSYSTLQRKQLTKQVYTDTQSTYLLVYAPGRHQALEHALENQLHRKFRLVTELAPALTDSVEGVLLVSEDLECTSTALTYFAAALRTGADFVVCDAAFGFDGSTALYLSTQHIPCSRCAMVSRKLLDRVRAAARGRDSVTELLRLATAMAENCHRIPQSLLHFRRELCADDVFSADGKRALILSHELTMTGAPIVLVSAVPVLRSLGFEVVVLGDVSDREECLRLYEETKSEKISVLVNCAGFGAVGSFDKLPLDTELKMIDTNVTAVHMLTKLFLKDFVAADRCYIMNIASSAGLMYGGPMMATYYASKAYVVSLTSAIYEELRARNSRVHVCAVCPGPVDTEFNDVANCKFGVSSITPQFCAKKALEGMFGRKLIIIPEKSIKALYAGAKFAPRGIVLKVTGKVQKKKLDK